MNGPSTTKTPTHRRLLVAAVCSLCKDCGFESVTKSAIESLAELLQFYMTELVVCCREFSELDHRTIPDLTDVKQALAEFGSDFTRLRHYICNGTKSRLRPLMQSKTPSEHKPFHTGLSRMLRPTYIPPHLPDFPDVHSFVRTNTVRKPDNEYRTIREKVAAQRMDTESSLVNFLSRTKPCATHIFDGVDTSKYSLIELPTEEFPYFGALLPAQQEDNFSLDNVDNLDDTTETTEDADDPGNISNLSAQDANDKTFSSSPTKRTGSSNFESPYFKEPKRIKRQ